MVLGAHVSIKGGVQNAPQNGVTLGCDAIQIFAKNQRQWNAKPYGAEDIAHFKENYKKSGLRGILVHDSYLINVGTANQAMWEKGRDGLLDEVERCDQLGIPYLNMHPGSHMGAGVDAGTKRIAEALEYVFDATKGSKVMVLLELMAGQGTNMGDRFEDLARVRALLGDDKRVGYCFDTCHMFAAGYDIRKPDTYRDVMKRADDILGLAQVRAFHLNDSKTPLGSHIDRHENIGKGTIGAKGFEPLLKDPRFRDAPMVLETPLAEEGYKDDLKALRKLL